MFLVCCWHQAAVMSLINIHLFTLIAILTRHLLTPWVVHVSYDCIVWGCTCITCLHWLPLLNHYLPIPQTRGCMHWWHHLFDNPEVYGNLCNGLYVRHILLRGKCTVPTQGVPGLVVTMEWPGIANTQSKLGWCDVTRPRAPLPSQAVGGRLRLFIMTC